MTKEDFLNKWIDALPLNSKDSDRKEMEYDLKQLQQKQLPTDDTISNIIDIVHEEQNSCGMITREEIFSKIREQLNK